MIGPNSTDGDQTGIRPEGSPPQEDAETRSSHSSQPKPTLGRNQLPLTTAFTWPASWRFGQLLTLFGVISPLVLIYAVAVLLGFVRERAYLNVFGLEYGLVSVDSQRLAFRSIGDLVSAVLFVLQIGSIVIGSQALMVNRFKPFHLTLRQYKFYWRWNTLAVALLGACWSFLAIRFDISMYVTMIVSLMLVILIYASLSAIAIPAGEYVISPLHSNPYRSVVFTAMILTILALFLGLLQVSWNGAAEARNLLQPDSRGVILHLTSNISGLDGKKLGLIRRDGDVILLASQTGDEDSTIIYWIPVSQIASLESTAASCSEVPCG